MPDSTDFCAVLRDYYNANDTDNPIDMLGINSKYYSVEDMNKNNAQFNQHYQFYTLHINIQGLRSSLDKLKHLLHKMECQNIIVDAILLCETFLQGEVSDEMYKTICKIKGYKLFLHNRVSIDKGGVAIYIRDTYQCKEMKNLSTFIEGEYESLFIKINKTPQSVVVGEIYRVPGTNEQLSIKRYEESLEKIQQHSSDIIIGTDQNFDFLKIKEHKNTSDLFELFISQGVLPTITRPTRITSKTATLIDNIYIQPQNHNDIVSGIITTKLSDHLPIFTFLGKKMNKRETVSMKYRVLNDDHLQKIFTEIESFNWNFLKSKTIEESYDAFTNKLNEILETVSPEKNKTFSPKNIIREPWVTKAILKSSNRLDKLYHQTLSHPSDMQVLQKYKTYRN